jgi:DNA polymerase-3 subunit alpha
MDQDFIKRKHGKDRVTYEHPLLEGILKETHGTLVYQE